MYFSLTKKTTGGFYFPFLETCVLGNTVACFYFLLFFDVKTSSHDCCRQDTHNALHRRGRTSSSLFRSIQLEKPEKPMFLKSAVYSRTVFTPQSALYHYTSHQGVCTSHSNRKASFRDPVHGISALIMLSTFEIFHTSVSSTKTHFHKHSPWLRCGQESES